MPVKSLTPWSASRRKAFREQPVSMMSSPEIQLRTVLATREDRRRSGPSALFTR
jgi:hypothetical protein